MKIPYVIDNQKYKLSDILNAILENHQGQSMDVVTAYFNIPYSESEINIFDRISGVYTCIWNKQQKFTAHYPFEIDKKGKYDRGNVSTGNQYPWRSVCSVDLQVNLRFRQSCLPCQLQRKNVRYVRI
jgi:hypothetical protein